MRRPKGIKTKKSVAKRFKITARGKVLRSSAGRRHLAQAKNPKRRRNLRGPASTDHTDVYRITQNLPFSHRGQKRSRVRVQQSNDSTL
jgi:large subunit ribosomal protein L35